MLKLVGIMSFILLLVIFAAFLSSPVAASPPATLSTCSPESLQLTRIQESRMKGDISATAIVKGTGDTYFVCVALRQGKAQADIYCQHVGWKDALEERYFYKAASVVGQISSFQVTNRKSSSLLIASIPDGQSILFLCYPKESVLKLIVVGNIGEKGVTQHSIVQHKKWAMLLSPSSESCFVGRKRHCNSHIPSAQIYQGSLLVTCESDEYGISTAVTGWTNGSEVYIAHALGRLDDPESLTLKVFRIANESGLSRCQLVSVASTRLDGICGVQSMKILRSWGKYYLILSSNRCDDLTENKKKVPRNLLGIMWDARTGRFLKDSLTEFEDTADGSSLATTSASTFAQIGHPGVASRIYCLSIEPPKGGFVEANNPVSAFGKVSLSVVAQLPSARGPACSTLGIYNNNNGQVYISHAWELGQENFVSVDKLACPGYPTQRPYVKETLARADEAYLRQPVNVVSEKAANLTFSGNGSLTSLNQTKTANCSTKPGSKPLPDNFPHQFEVIPDEAAKPETVTLMSVDQKFFQPLLPHRVAVPNFVEPQLRLGHHKMAGEQYERLPAPRGQLAGAPWAPFQGEHVQDWFDQIEPSDYEEILPQFIVRPGRVVSHASFMPSIHLQVKPPIPGALTAKLTGSLPWLADHEDIPPEFSTQSTVKVDMEPGIYVGGRYDTSDIADLSADYEEIDQSQRIRAQGRRVSTYNTTGQDRRTTVLRPVDAARLTAVDATKQEFPEKEQQPPAPLSAKKQPMPVLRKPAPVNVRRMKFSDTLESATPSPAEGLRIEPRPETKYAYRPVAWAKAKPALPRRMRYNDSITSNRIRYTETLGSHRLLFNGSQIPQVSEISPPIRPLRKPARVPSLILLPSKHGFQGLESSIATPIRHAFSQDYEEVVQIVPEDIAHYEDFEPSAIPSAPRLFMNHSLGKHPVPEILPATTPAQVANLSVHDETLLEGVDYHYDDDEYHDRVFPSKPSPTGRRRQNVTSHRLQHNITVAENISMIHEEHRARPATPSPSTTVTFRKKVTKTTPVRTAVTKGSHKRLRPNATAGRPSRRLRTDDTLGGRLRHTNVSISERLGFLDTIHADRAVTLLPRTKPKRLHGVIPRHRYGNFTKMPGQMRRTTANITTVPVYEPYTTDRVEYSTAMPQGIHMNDTAMETDRLHHVENNYLRKQRISFRNDTSYTEADRVYQPNPYFHNITAPYPGVQSPGTGIGSYLSNYTVKYRGIPAPHLEQIPGRLRFDDTAIVHGIAHQNESFSYVPHLPAMPYGRDKNVDALSRNDSYVEVEEIIIPPHTDRNFTLTYKQATKAPSSTEYPTVMSQGIHIKDTAMETDRLHHAESNYLEQQRITLRNDTSYAEAGRVYQPKPYFRNMTVIYPGITSPPRVGSYLSNYTVKYHGTPAPHLEPIPGRLRFDDTVLVDTTAHRNESFSYVPHLPAIPYRRDKNRNALSKNDSNFEVDEIIIPPHTDRNFTLMYKQVTEAPSSTEYSVVMPQRIHMNGTAVETDRLNYAETFPGQQRITFRNDSSYAEADRVYQPKPYFHNVTAIYPGITWPPRMGSYLSNYTVKYHGTPAPHLEPIPGRLRFDDTVLVDASANRDESFSYVPHVPATSERIFQHVGALSRNDSDFEVEDFTMTPPIERNFTLMYKQPTELVTEAPSLVSTGYRLHYGNLSMDVDRMRYNTSRQGDRVHYEERTHISAIGVAPPVDSYSAAPPVDIEDHLELEDDYSYDYSENPIPYNITGKGTISKPVNLRRKYIKGFKDTRLHHNITTLTDRISFSNSTGVRDQIHFDDIRNVPEIPKQLNGSLLLLETTTQVPMLTKSPNRLHITDYITDNITPRIHHDDIVASDRIQYGNRSLHLYTDTPRLTQYPHILDVTEYGETDEVLRLRFEDSLGISDRIKFEDRIPTIETYRPSGVRSAVIKPVAMVTSQPVATVTPPGTQYQRMVINGTSGIGYLESLGISDKLRFDNRSFFNMYNEENNVPISNDKSGILKRYPVPVEKAPEAGVRRLRHNQTTEHLTEPEVLPPITSTKKSDVRLLFNQTLSHAAVKPALPVPHKISGLHEQLTSGTLVQDEIRGHGRMSHLDDLLVPESPAAIIKDQISVPVSSKLPASDRLKHNGTLSRLENEQLFHQSEILHPGFLLPPARDSVIPSGADFSINAAVPVPSKSRLRVDDISKNERISHMDDIGARDTPVPVVPHYPVQVPDQVRYNATVTDRASSRLRHNQTLGTPANIFHDDLLGGFEVSAPRVLPRYPNRTASVSSPPLPHLPSSTFSPLTNNSQLAFDHIIEDARPPHVDNLQASDTFQPVVKEQPSAATVERVRYNETAMPTSRLRHHDTLGVSERIVYDQALDGLEIAGPALVPHHIPVDFVTPTAFPVTATAGTPILKSSLLYDNRFGLDGAREQNRMLHTDDLTVDEVASPVAPYASGIRRPAQPQIGLTVRRAHNETARDNDRLQHHESMGTVNRAAYNEDLDIPEVRHPALVPQSLGTVHIPLTTTTAATSVARTPVSDNLPPFNAQFRLPSVKGQTRLLHTDDLQTHEAVPSIGFGQPPPKALYIPLSSPSELRHNDTMATSRLVHNDTLGITDRLLYDQTLDGVEVQGPAAALRPVQPELRKHTMFNDTLISTESLQNRDGLTFAEETPNIPLDISEGGALQGNEASRLRYHHVEADRMVHTDSFGIPDTARDADFGFVAVNASLQRSPSGIQTAAPEMASLPVGTDIHPLDDRLMYRPLPDSNNNRLYFRRTESNDRFRHNETLGLSTGIHHDERYGIPIITRPPAFIPVLRPDVGQMYHQPMFPVHPFPEMFHESAPEQFEGIRHNRTFGVPDRMRYSDDMLFPEKPYLSQPHNALKQALPTPSWIPRSYPLDMGGRVSGHRLGDGWILEEAVTSQSDISHAPDFEDTEMDTAYTRYPHQQVTYGAAEDVTPVYPGDVTKHREIMDTDYVSADYVEIHHSLGTTPFPSLVRNHTEVINRLRHNESHIQNDRLQFHDNLKPGNDSERSMAFNITRAEQQKVEQSVVVTESPEVYTGMFHIAPNQTAMRDQFMRQTDSDRMNGTSWTTDRLKQGDELHVEELPMPYSYYPAPPFYNVSQYRPVSPPDQMLPIQHIISQHPTADLPRLSPTAAHREQSKIQLPNPSRISYSDQETFFGRLSHSEDLNDRLKYLEAMPTEGEMHFLRKVNMTYGPTPYMPAGLRSSVYNRTEDKTLPTNSLYPAQAVPDWLLMAPVIPTQNISMEPPNMQREHARMDGFEELHGVARLRHNVSLEDHGELDIMPTVLGVQVLPSITYPDFRPQPLTPATMDAFVRADDRQIHPTNQSVIPGLPPTRPVLISQPSLLPPGHRVRSAVPTGPVATVPIPVEQAATGKINISTLTDADITQMFQAQQTYRYKHPNTYMLSREAMNEELMDSGYDEKSPFTFTQKHGSSYREHRKLQEHVTKKRPLANRDPVSEDYEEGPMSEGFDATATDHPDTTYDQLEAEDKEEPQLVRTRKTHSKIKVSVRKPKGDGKKIVISGGQSVEEGDESQPMASPGRLRYYDDMEGGEQMELQRARSKHRRPAVEREEKPKPTDAVDISNNLTVQVRLKNVIKVIKGGRRGQLPQSPYGTNAPEGSKNDSLLPTVSTKIHEVTIRNRSSSVPDNVILNVNSIIGNDSTSTMHSVQVKLVQTKSESGLDACSNRLRIENTDYVKHVYCYRNSTDVPIRLSIGGGSGSFSYTIIKEFRGIHDGRRFRFEESGGDLYPRVPVRPDVMPDNPNYLRPDHDYYVPVRVIDDVCEDSAETLLTISYMCRKARRFG